MHDYGIGCQLSNVISLRSILSIHTNSPQIYKNWKVLSLEYVQLTGIRTVQCCNFSREHHQPDTSNLLDLIFRNTVLS